LIHLRLRTYEFLFSVPRQVEGFRQVQGGLVEGQALEGRLEIEHDAVGAAVGVEARKEFFCPDGRKS
jgi:hypothetical protein